MVMETTNLPQTYIASEGASAERAVNKGVRSVRPSARMVPSLWYYNCTDSVLIRLYPQLEYVHMHVHAISPSSHGYNFISTCNKCTVY